MRRRGELAALALVLVLFGAVYGSRDRLLPYSDPVTWYAFGMRFRDAFGETRLAYLYPLYLAGAIAVAGPVKGFLANVPVLVGLAAALYAFARQLARPLACAPLAAAAALAFWLTINPRLLLAFTSPYRDPLSHLLVLLACVALVAARRRPRRRVAAAAASGACLALAVSVREPAGLVLLPFLLYALGARRAQPDLPFWRPALAFGAAFAVAIAPLLIQNHRLSGNPLLPGQAIESVESAGRLFVGLRWSHFPQAFPRTLSFLADHYGAPGIAGIALGLWTAVRRRSLEALALALPAFVAYAILYSCYTHDFAIPRYLFVLDLFAAPLVGLGLAALVGAAADALPARRRRAALVAACVAAFGGAAGAIGVQRDVEHRRPTSFRLAHAERMRADLERLLPRGARVLAEFPVGEMILAFASDRCEVVRHRLPLRDLPEVLASGGAAYVISYDDLAAGDDALARGVRSRFHVEGVASFDTDRWGVRVPDRPRLYVDRVSRAWPDRRAR